MNFRLEHPALLVMLGIFAAVTHTLKVEGATARSSYQISWIAYGASFVLLDPTETMAVLVVAHVTEWLWHRSPWYIALFNLTAFGIIASTSALLWQLISAGSTPFTPLSAFAYLAAAAAFTILNHLMVGLVIWLARGENLMRSGVFNGLTLMIDFISFGMGIASGLIWLVNPYAVIFILSPLYLIYTTLQVPSLQHQTRLEPKTGLYNARFFSETLATELERADKFNRPLTVVMADLDLLRNVNNNYGHLAGDTVIVGIANTLREFVRDYDIIARFGGEEYAILLPETTLAQALPLVEQLRQRVASAQYEVSTSVTPLSITMSFGVAEREFHGQAAEQIIHNADLAVYRSKSTTRNRVCFYEDGEIKDYSQGEAPIVRSTDESEQHVHSKISQLRQELENHAGTQFDSRIVDAFTQVIKAQGETLIVNSARNISQMIEQQDLNVVEQTPEKVAAMPVDDELTANQLHSELDNMTVALQRAIAAHRRMEVSAQEGRDLAETLLKVASTINMTLDLDRVLTVILDQLALVMDYDNASIMLLKGDMLNSMARSSIHVPESQSFSVPVQKLRHIQEVMQTQHAVVISDTYDDPRWMRRAGSEQIRCWLGIPLMVQNRIIGLMNLSIGLPDYYTARHVQVATAFAAHAAIAIENARLFTQAQNELAERERAEEALRQSQEHLQERVIELQIAKAAEEKQRELAETLSEAAHSLNSSLSLQEVLSTILTYLGRVVSSDSIAVKLISSQTTDLLAHRSNKLHEWQFAKRNFDLLPLEKQVVQKRMPVIVRNATIEPMWQIVDGTEKIASWLGVPLMVQDNVVGLLTLTKQEANYYNDTDARLVAAFANQAAIAITNARLYEQVQEELVERMRAEKALEEERASLAQRVEERTSELKEANEQLTSALRTKDEFLATMSHELRTPLNAILLLSESMQNGVYGSIESRQVTVLDNVKQSARHLLSLINDILDMSKIEAGMFEIDKGPVSVVAICRNSLKIIDESARGKGITLVQQFDDQVDTVNGDERRLAQILVNLLSNAIKFTPEGGTVGLDVIGDRAAGMVNFIVWDTGIGIAQKDIKRLFQPFVQLDSKLSRLYEGTGLGLALVDRLAKLHGGVVTLESELDKGSRFTVSIPWQEDDDFVALTLNLLGSERKIEEPGNLPLSDDEWLASLGLDAFDLGTPETEEPQPAAYPRGVHENVSKQARVNNPLHRTQPIILLVEDNDISIEAMYDYLSANNYYVIVAHNGAEAIAMADEWNPDLILMDVQMPDMDGLEATSKIRTNPKHAEIPIIALTALAMPGDRDRCLEAGVNEYLSKPVSMKHLLQVMALQLPGHHLQHG